MYLIFRVLDKCTYFLRILCNIISAENLNVTMNGRTTYSRKSQGPTLSKIIFRRLLYVNNHNHHHHHGQQGTGKMTKGCIQKKILGSLQVATRSSQVHLVSGIVLQNLSFLFFVWLSTLRQFSFTVDLIIYCALEFAFSYNEVTGRFLTTKILDLVNVTAIGLKFSKSPLQEG